MKGFYTTQVWFHFCQTLNLRFSQLELHVASSPMIQFLDSNKTIQTLKFWPCCGASHVCHFSPFSTYLDSATLVFVSNGCHDILQFKLSFMVMKCCWVATKKSTVIKVQMSVEGACPPKNIMGNDWLWMSGYWLFLSNQSAVRVIQHFWVII